MKDSDMNKGEELKIDLNQYIKVFCKHKITFFAVFSFILAIGFAVIQFTPKIYRISMLVKLPFTGESSYKPIDHETAENLRSLIINGAFNDEMRERLKSGLDNDGLSFMVVIPAKTDILQITVDRGIKTKESGVDILKELFETMTTYYAKRIDARVNEVNNYIKQNEQAILIAKEKAGNFQEQIREITDRENKLRDEIKAINLNTAGILSKHEAQLKGNSASDGVSSLFIANYIQNNSSYLNQVNNQFSELALRKANLNYELKCIDSQIKDLQLKIDTLNASKDFISNMKIISQPRVSTGPIGLNKKKILAISIVMGLFFGVLAVFLHEFWINNLSKRSE